MSGIPVPADAPTGPTLRDADVARLGEYVYRRTGLRFGSGKRYFVEKRVTGLMAEAGADDFASYFAGIRMGDDAGFQRLVNELTVNETYFLREDYQFDSLVRSVLPQVLADRRARGAEGEAVRVLSLPCSSGEEAYSIAIRLLEDWPPIETVDVSIVGGDIDTRVLEAAREGVYGVRSLQRLPQHLLDRYFEPVAGRGRRVASSVREAIGFRRINVCDAREMRQLHGFDVIFCRNLLIYFDEVSCRLAAENLFGALRPGGFLYLGHSESMSRISPIFTPVRFPEGIAYRRPDLAQPGGRT